MTKSLFYAALALSLAGLPAGATAQTPARTTAVQPAGVQPAGVQPAALQRLDAERACLVMVDFTTGLYPIVQTIDTDEMLNNAVAAAKTARLFELPILVLGDEGGFYGEMHPAVKSFAGAGQPFERTTPSAYASGGFRAALEASGRTQVLIGGITTDNCTLLTSLDLLRAGYEVFVVTDISGSDSEAAEEAALARLRDAGAVTISWITIGSELLDTWQTPEGASLTQIYGQHMNGPITSRYGSTADDARMPSEAEADGN